MVIFQKTNDTTRDLQALNTVINQLAKAGIITHARARTQEEECNSISTGKVFFFPAIIPVWHEENEDRRLPMYAQIAEAANIQTAIKQLVARGV